MHKPSWILVCLAITTAACSSSSDPGSSSSDAGSSSNDDAGDNGRRDAGSTSHADAGAKDSGASLGIVSDGAEGKSCTDACKSQSMHCTPTCQFADSLHGGEVGPYAGSGFYSYTTTSADGSFTTNGIRFEASCDTVFTTTWTDNPDDPGTPYTVDYTYTSTPISCCCAH